MTRAGVERRAKTDCERAAQLSFASGPGLDQDACHATRRSGEALHDRQWGGGDRAFGNSADLATGDRRVEREVFGARADADGEQGAGPSADRVRGRFGQDQQPSVGGFAGTLELQGELATERGDLFGGADQGERPAAFRPDGDDRLLEDRRGGLHAGHVFDLFGDALFEAFGSPRGEFERRAAGDAVRDFFKGAGDAAVGDLDGEQQCNTGCDPHDGHQLAQRLDTQMTPVEEKQGSEVADHPPIAVCASRSGSVNRPSRIPSTRSA